MISPSRAILRHLTVPGPAEKPRLTPATGRTADSGICSMPRSRYVPLGAVVVALDVQPQPDHVRLARARSTTCAYRDRKTPRRRASWTHVNALNPPEPAVAPVAPLEGDLQLAEHASRLPRRDSTAPSPGSASTAATPRARTAGSRDLALALRGQTAVEIDDDGASAGSAWRMVQGMVASGKETRMLIIPRRERGPRQWI